MGRKSHLIDHSFALEVTGLHAMGGQWGTERAKGVDDARCIVGRGANQKIEVACRAGVAVGGQRVGPNHQEVDLRFQEGGEDVLEIPAELIGGHEGLLTSRPGIVARV
jgi:hypothetical protein